MTIVAESDGFLINYDGQRFCYKFRYRMPLENIRSIRTDNGFVKVGYVSCVLMYIAHHHLKGKAITRQGLFRILLSRGGKCIVANLQRGQIQIQGATPY